MEHCDRLAFGRSAIVVACSCRVQPFAKQAVSFWIVIYIPQLVLALLFLGRLHVLSRRMVKGDNERTQKHIQSKAGQRCI